MKVIVRVDNKTVFEGSLADLYNVAKIGSYSYEGSSGFTFHVEGDTILIEYNAEWTYVYLDGKEVKTPKKWLI